MSPDDLKRARSALGELWGKDRALTCAELGRALRMGPKDPGQSIRDYEAGKPRIPGPVCVAVEMMLRGALPPDGIP
ncbi:MAG: hypothetical protein ACM3W4_02130 [Ignavibacteriales bacterium]